MHATLKIKPQLQPVASFLLVGIELPPSCDDHDGDKGEAAPKSLKHIRLGFSETSYEAVSGSITAPAKAAAASRRCQLASEAKLYQLTRSPVVQEVPE